MSHQARKPHHILSMRCRERMCTIFLKNDVERHEAETGGLFDGG